MLKVDIFMKEYMLKRLIHKRTIKGREGSGEWYSGSYIEGIYNILGLVIQVSVATNVYNIL